MKRDFQKEYEEYMKNNTPDLWSRIEKEIDDMASPCPEDKEEELRAKDTIHEQPGDGRDYEEAAKDQPAGRILRFPFAARWILPAAACLCLAIGAGRIAFMREPFIRNEADATAAADSLQESERSSTAASGSDRPDSETAEEYDAYAYNNKSESHDVSGYEGAYESHDTYGYESALEEPLSLAAGADMTGMRNMEPSLTASCVPESPSWYPYDDPVPGESYAHEDENGFSLTALSPLSTFSADVDTASYANIRRMIEDGLSMEEIPADAVRLEEFLNYFSYDLALPEGSEPFGVTLQAAECPWNDAHQLLMIGLQARPADFKEAPPRNLVFLIDVSGSMDDSLKLPLLKRAFLELTDSLTEKDTISIVTYAGGTEVLLEGVKGSERDQIRRAIEGLNANGSTNGEGGIQKAYDLAQRFYLDGGNNRILLATDGDLNVGISEPDQLEKLVSEKRKSGIYLSVLGFGTGNLRDDNLERLADCGNGSYSYIDSILEARKVLVEEMGATFFTVAEDVRLQVEFNPATVNAYRLLGYENRQMEDWEFLDDAKDAGEIGAGHNVIVLYELIPSSGSQAVELKYQNNAAGKAPVHADEYATLKIRYKEPGGNESTELAYVIPTRIFTDSPDEDFTFASLAAEFAMLLQDSPYKGDASLEGILQQRTDKTACDEYRQDFFSLVRTLLRRG